jgi:hypothetical protein
MVKVSLETKLPDIQGLEEGQQPLHLLQDADLVLYLVTDAYELRDQLKNFPSSGRVFIGRENEEMIPVDKVLRLNTYRDGGTTEVWFIIDDQKGEIQVPAPIHQGIPTLIFGGEEKELRKVGYRGAYLFNELNP